MALWDKFLKAALEFVFKHKDEVVDWANKLSAKAKDFFRGKKLAIIGPVAVGKNSFFNRLQGIEIPEQHVNTKAMEKISTFRLRRHLPDGKSFNITVKRSANVGGEEEQRDRFWLDACQEADVIFYMLELNDLRSGRCQPGGRVYDDLEWLGRHFGQMNGSPKVHFLVNKIDLELKSAKHFDAFESLLEPLIKEFEKSARNALGPYEVRITGISPISMLDAGIFNRSFVCVMEAVYEAAHGKTN